MTPEQIIKFVCEKLDAQDCQSTDGARCLYRGPNGTKCAIGHLIPDEQYDPEMEQGNILALRDRFAEVPVVRDLIIPNYDLLGKLQECHDFDWRAGEETFTEAWERECSG